MSNQFNPAYPQAAGLPAQGPAQGQAMAPGQAGGPAAYQAQAGHGGYGQGGYGQGGYGQSPYGAAYPAGQGQYAHYHGYAGYPGVPYQSQYQSQTTPFFNFSNDRFLKGLLIGAAAAYILTNESVQRTAIKGVVKAWSMLQGGVEEIKERFQDAEAEIRAGDAAAKE
jgi:hypothetical protein